MKKVSHFHESRLSAYLFSFLFCLFVKKKKQFYIQHWKISILEKLKFQQLYKKREKERILLCDDAV